MEILPTYIQVLSYLFLIVYMFSVGLETKPNEIITLLKSPKFIFNALFANLVLVPVVCLILLKVFTLSPDIKTGLLLLAFAPGGLFALNFARVSKGNVHLAVALLILLAVVGIIFTPLFAQFFLGADQKIVRILRLMFLLLMLIPLPILLGKWLAQHMQTDRAEKLAKFIGTLSIVLFVLVTFLSSGAKKPAMKSMGINGVAFIALLVIISWTIGWILGGKEVRDKKTMAIATSLRNVGVCLPIAIHDFSGTNVFVPILAFSGISIPMNFLFSLVTKFAFRDEEESQLANQPVISK